MAILAAIAADCPRTINTGSILIEPNAIWVADKQAGTKRLFTSDFFGTIDL
jgi:hypothetical protein